MSDDLPSRITVRLRSIQGNLITREDAIALLDKLERYAVVVLDFSGIENCGGAFLEEVFGKWATDHPSIHITPTNMSAGVEPSVHRLANRGKKR